MSSSSESDSDLTSVSDCQPRTRRGLAKQHAADGPSSEDCTPSENSIYSNQVFRLNNLAAKRTERKEVYKKPEDFKKKTTEQDSDGKSTASSCSLNTPLKVDELSPVVKDPTPPSTPKRVAKQRGKRMKKGVKAAMTSLQKMKKSMNEKDDDDVMIIDKDSNQMSDSHSFSIKIRMPSGVKKFQIKPAESFANVFSSIAADEDVDENDIFMFFNDSTVHIYDSPNALGITVADILECHIHSSHDHSPVPTEMVDAVEDKMLIRLNLQMIDCKSKTTLSIRKDEPMEKLMREFCRTVGRSFGTLKFISDGENVELSDTPESLDLETDFCIDVLKC